MPPAAPDHPDSGIRVLAFSDWRVQDHNDLLKILSVEGPVDVILYAGDDILRFVTPERNYFAELAKHANCGKVLAVAGNDDDPVMSKILLNDPSVHDLHDRPYFYRDAAFFGIEGSTKGPAVLHHDETEVAAQLGRHWQVVKKRKAKTAVLVTHPPPDGVLDIGRRFGQENIGSTAVRSFLAKRRVALCVCGHCHSFGGRTEELGQTLVVNIASHDNPGAVGNFAFITISGGEVVDINLRSTRELDEGYELHRLTGVGRKTIRKLVANGISTLDQVTEDNFDKVRVKGVGATQARRWIAQADLMRSGATDLRVFDKNRLGFLADGHHIIWDIETDLDMRRIWLIGGYDTKTRELRQFFYPDNEKKCVEEFCDWVKSVDPPSTISFSGTRFDTRVLAVSLRRGRLGRFSPLLERDVDLCNTIRYGCVFPWKELKLRTLAPRLGFNDFKHPHIDGFATGWFYTNYLLGRRKPKPRDWKPYIEHNDEDVRALHHVLERVRLAHTRL